MKPGGVGGSNIECSDRAMVAGMRSVQWPGRLQWSEWPAVVAARCDSDGSNYREVQDTSALWPVLLDGAHNPAAAEALCTYVDGELRRGKSKPKLSLPGAGQRPIVWVIALSKGKDARSLLSKLLRDGDSAVFVPFPVSASSGRVSHPNFSRPRTFPSPLQRQRGLVDSMEAF